MSWQWHCRITIKSNCPINCPQLINWQKTCRFTSKTTHVVCECISMCRTFEELLLWSPTYWLSPVMTYLKQDKNVCGKLSMHLKREERKSIFSFTSLFLLYFIWKYILLNSMTFCTTTNLLALFKKYTSIPASQVTLRASSYSRRDVHDQTKGVRQITHMGMWNSRYIYECLKR